ncbi:hypothetical protein GWK48_09935 [Metallosphaera tengchongensis]|uniref:Uncharacterized protein n=1 Tax=Metallosphaera tengchongensis TaxID=1532350 RepID=A0A6N0NVA0_9CREN|nr:hypothetical protein [Metallosphaera tengchongensis]QKR00662.1 hypothetical protein GWK48_09935 [Metallosphaera tengchongensis]
MILTSDPSTFHSLPPLPKRLLPNFVKGRKYPPYGLRKIESLTGGIIIPPEKLELHVKDGTLLGVYANDPLGMSEVSKGLETVFGEPPGHVASFREFSEKVRTLKGRFNLKVVVGGPGSWELSLNSPDWIDVLLVGEAELTLPKILTEESRGVFFGEKTHKFFPIKAPSAMAEVEVKRKDRKVPLEVVEEEMKVQSTQGMVNLISDDLFSYGEGLIPLLSLGKKYGKVLFSQITLQSSSEVDLGKVREVLGLNPKDWRSPVLSEGKGSCTIGELDMKVMGELNRNFIYPMVYVHEERVPEFAQFKSIIIPLPTSQRYYEVLYRSWVHNRRVANLRLGRILDYVLYKNAVTNGEYIRRLKLRGIHLVNLLLIVLGYLVNELTSPLP